MNGLEISILIVVGLIFGVLLVGVLAACMLSSKISRQEEYEQYIKQKGNNND